MDIGPYILQLLALNKKVGVSGLGTFYLQTRASYFDTTKKLWHPPTRQAAFDEEVFDEDQLPELISTEKNISEQSAVYFVEKFVTNIRVLLAASQSATLEGIGKLSYRDDQLIFNPDDSAGADHSFYGLAPVPAIKKTEVIPVQQPETVIQEEVYEEEEERRGGTGKFIWIGLILLLAGAALAYTFYPQVFDRFIQPKTDPPAQKAAPATAPNTRADSLAKADSIVKELEKQGFEVEKPKDTLTLSTEVTKIDPEFTYEIIGASLANTKEAESYIKKKKKQGIAASIAQNMPGKRIKITLGSFNSQAAAEKELVRIRKDIEKEAWVYRARRPKTP